MPDMFETIENPYKGIYAALAEVREVFHREGRISDSNAKLDETIKFLAIHFARSQNLISDKEYEPLLEQETFRVKKLNDLFIQIAKAPPFANPQLGSIFGSRPSTAFEPGDEAVAFELFRASGYALKAQSSNAKSLDVLNEAFGHHVRDNFRNHIEDAQYMTPPEVVEFMVQLAADELVASLKEHPIKTLNVLDPSCGVGSFLTAFRREFRIRFENNKRTPQLLGIGQDKVERMVRLSLINLIFSKNHTDQIFVGNSILDGSPLDEFNGKIDLILTNPPFGAKFPLSTIRAGSKAGTPIFASGHLSQKTVDSELLFIDRYLALLRPGGLCLAVVPDGVISAKGTASYLRQQLGRLAELCAVIELPPATFAQAGTRTKTAVLMFRKPHGSRQNGHVFFAEADDLGFEVAKRKGVPIKRTEGHNQLPDILEAYKKRSDREHDAISRPLVAAWRDINPTEFDAWTPRQFIKKRTYDKAEENRFSLQTLSDLVKRPARRKMESYSKDKLFISVLHVIGEGVLDVPGIRSYRPITPGIRIFPGEVIISRLNPRIPRVIVVPDLGQEMLCSSEFEALVPNENISPYALAYLLLTPIVQMQIRALTAGTSASHARVKPAKIYEINVPWPKAVARSDFDHTVTEYRRSMESLVSSMRAISDLRRNEDPALLA